MHFRARQAHVNTTKISESSILSPQDAKIMGLRCFLYVSVFSIPTWGPRPNPYALACVRTRT